MKKIVSALGVLALSLSSVFAADISLEYNTKGTVYEQKTVKSATDGTKTTTKTVLNQNGYADATSDFVLKAESDIGGFVLDVDPNASDSTKTLTLDEYYGWMNFGNLQITMGKWTGRYVRRINADAGNWESDDFERYKPGVIGGKYAKDIDNLTYNTAADTSALAAALAYTIRPNDDTAIMFKGLAVTLPKDEYNQRNASGDIQWGGTIGNDDGNYQNKFFSSFAGEFAARLEGLFDFNVAVRSEKRNALAVGAFFRPMFLGNTSLLIGGSFGTDLKDYGEGVDSNYYEFGVDLRARVPLTDSLAITTMNNVSSYTDSKIKGQSIDPNSLLRAWNMVSLAYSASEQLLLQFTAQAEWGIHSTQEGADDEGNAKNVDLWVGDLGGFKLSFIPGVTWSFNENASFTAGVKFEIGNVGASGDYKAANNRNTSFSIPFVFDVAL